MIDLSGIDEDGSAAQMSDLPDFDGTFDPTFTLGRLAFRAGLEIGKELRRAVDSPSTQTRRLDQKVEIDYGDLPPGHFNYGDL